MSKHLQYPKVILVGRTNVGKSTLFNRLVSEKKSIVFDREGVTRDYVQQPITWQDKTFELIDTGGILSKKIDNSIAQQAQEKALNLFNQAALLLFIVDGKNGLTLEDRAIAKILFKTKKPIVVLVNKADNHNALEENMAEFYTLGCKTIIQVSGIHGIGINTLLNTIVETLKNDTPTVIEKPAHNIVIIGKPNVGKSSLMNILANQERSIVSDIAGTTRESISQNIYYCHDLIQLTDTAGIRKKARIDDDLETLMVKSSFASVDEADTVIIMFDASQGKLSDQELKLLFYTFEQKKCMLAIFNKIDLLDDYKKLTLAQDLESYAFILNKIPILNISCLTQKNTSYIFNELSKIWQRCQQEFHSTSINEHVQEALKYKILYHTGIQLKLFKIRSILAPIPTFVLHVNKPEWFGESELNCIENILRKGYDLKGCPVKFIVKGI